MKIFFYRPRNQDLAEAYAKTLTTTGAEVVFTNESRDADIIHVMYDDQRFVDITGYTLTGSKSFIVTYDVPHGRKPKKSYRTVLTFAKKL